MARDVRSLRSLASATLDLTESSRFPSKILYPSEFFPHTNPDHQRMVDEFVGVLERFLGIRKTTISLAERWNACPPEAAQGKSLREYLGEV